MFGRLSQLRRLVTTYKVGSIPLPSRMIIHSFSTSPRFSSNKSQGSSVADKYQHRLANKKKTRYVLLSGVKTDGSTKRFYKTAGVRFVDNKYALTLGGRLVSSPSNNLVAFPTEKLAMAVALEWNSQTLKIRPHTMPLMHLTISVLDHVSVNRKDLEEHLLTIIATDNIVHRESGQPALARLEKKYLDPVLQWLEQKYDAKMNLSFTTIAVPQFKETTEKMKVVLNDLNDWQLACVDSLCGVTRSLVVSQAIVENQLGVEKGFECARLEEEYQIRKWGEVEGHYGHGIDREYVRMKIAAARTLLNLLEI